MELGSTAAGIDALTGGAVDIAATCPDALLVSDAPVRIGGGIVDRPPTAIVAKHGIASIEALRGRRVGTTSAQGSVSLFLRAALRLHGLARGDYDEVVVGTTPAQAAALERGDIDAAMLTSPYYERLMTRGFTQVADVGAELGACAFTTLNVRAGWTATGEWRAARDAIAAAMRRVDPAMYDIAVARTGIDRLLGLMRGEGLPTRSTDDVIDPHAEIR